MQTRSISQTSKLSNKHAVITFIIMNLHFLRLMKMQRGRILWIHTTYLRQICLHVSPKHVQQCIYFWKASSQWKLILCKLQQPVIQFLEFIALTQD